MLPFYRFSLQIRQNKKQFPSHHLVPELYFFLVDIIDEHHHMLFHPETLLIIFGTVGKFQIESVLTD